MIRGPFPGREGKQAHIITVQIEGYHEQNATVGNNYYNYFEGL